MKIRLHHIERAFFAARVVSSVGTVKARIGDARESVEEAKSELEALWGFLSGEDDEPPAFDEE